MARGYDQRGWKGSATPKHARTQDAWIGGKHALDPFRTDVAPSGGDDQIIFAAQHSEVAIYIQMSKIACSPWPSLTTLVQIARHDRGAVHDDLPSIYRNVKAGERAANSSAFALCGCVQRNDRATFRQPITLENRDPDIHRRLRGGFANRCAANGDNPQ